MNLDEETLEDYLGNNIARMIGIEPTPAASHLSEADAGPQGRAPARDRTELARSGTK
jgi:hypothetical protein